MFARRTPLEKVCCEYGLPESPDAVRRCGEPATVLWQWDEGVYLFLCPEHDDIMQSSEETGYTVFPDEDSVSTKLLGADAHFALALFHTLRSKPLMYETSKKHDEWLKAYTALDHLNRDWSKAGYNLEALKKAGLIHPICLQQTLEEFLEKARPKRSSESS